MICESHPQTRVGDAVSGLEESVVVRGVKVTISRTACYLGGSRAWLVCPACSGKYAILYPIYCRHCLDLHYAGEHESKLDRLLRKAIRHRQRFGQIQGGIAAPFPQKPYRMRWHTYLRARRKAQDMETQIAQLFAKQIRL